ncbi:TauD/TfdA family dioxygenase [Marilutibacter spongiae]|uniref:TauD/TfdA family dioxygenase n=1 Tax=Marilutibacter spongiae TaxID=2025720 RepID=A0A7W3TPE5_9GAMM|nr:TauD/TfdA family dioxygenase [Lysobacter spongiae]MBB1062078.1 TauD/TfdA family dioxygenase [Lysobacter spongiae]
MNRIADIGCGELEELGGARILLGVEGTGMRATEWAEENRADVERLLRENGALLVRGLRFTGSQQFGTVLKTLFGEELVQYTYRSTPRTELRGNVYTATEYHADQTIPQHNENSYSNRWAMRLGFLCTTPAEQGGATPICDSRRILECVPDALRARFEAHGVLYVRNYTDLDIPWTEVFQTDDKGEVEAFCRDNQLDFEWVSDAHLRTRQVNQATAIHPDNGARVWFNQAHLFHVSNLEREVRDSLLATIAEPDLPRNTYYGNGDPIADEDLRTIRALYEAHQVAFQWQRNDLLLLDNMLYSHGRTPFSGNRQVLVGMARIHGSTPGAGIA